jgi:uncharacterized repeat protein (TIGR01451 family)
MAVHGQGGKAVRRLQSIATLLLLSVAGWFGPAPAFAQGTARNAAPGEAPPVVIPPSARPPASTPPEQIPAGVVRDADSNLRPAAPALGPNPVLLAPPAQSQPMVALEMIGPESASVGLPVSYELVVRNQGRAPVAHVKVEDELPAGVRYLGGEPKAEFPGERLSWNLGVMEPATERRIKVVVQTNTEGDFRSKAQVSFVAVCGLTTHFTRPKLAVSVTGPETVLVGEAVPFQIRVANTGSGAISRIILRDRLPAGLQHPSGNQIEADIGGLGPGESRTITLRTTAVKSGQHVNEIFATADNGATPSGIQLTGGARNPDLECSAKSQVRVLEPALQVRVSGPKVCLVKCEGVFSIDVANPGNAPCHGVRLVTNLPEGLDFVAVSDDGAFDAATRSISWGFPALDAGVHRVLTVKTRGSAIADGSMMVSGQADGNLTAKAELPVKVEGIPALSLEVTDPDDPAPVGTDFTYEIRIVNQGTCPCTGIQITAQMPEGMELREAQAPAPYKVVGQQIQFASFTRLATKADIVYRVKVRCSKPGDVRFRVQLTCDQLQQPVLKEESSRFYNP